MRMKNNYISQLHFISKHLFALLVLGLLVFGAGSMSAVTYYSAGNNAPNTRTNWWTNTNGTGTNPSNFSTAGNIFVIQSGHTMTTTATWTVSGAGSTIQINTGGTLVASNTVTTSVMTVASGGTYQHNVNGGTIPTATWDAGSNCNITGIINATSLVGLGQTFGNFNWNCTSQTSNLYMESNITIAGNFSILSTGSLDINNHTLRMSNTSNAYVISVNKDVNIATNSTFKMNNGNGSCTMNIGGNFTINNSADFVIVTGNANSIVNVTGAVNIAGTLGMQEDNSNTTGTLNVKGNFSIASTGTITESSNNGGIGAINFNGTTTQTYSSAGTISNTINFAVNNGAILDVGTSVINGGGTFTLNSGASIITAHTQGFSTTGATGSIQVTGTRTYNAAANYTYNGTSAQVTGNGLTQNIPANITINSTSTVTLSAATTLSGNLLISSGILNTSNYDLSLGGNFNNSGTFTAGSSNITLNGTATQSIDGLTTTGTVNLLKTGGVATFQGNVNAANLTINGTGGTLNLGSGKSHTFTGTVSGTAGTLQAGSSTLNINGTIGWSGAIWDYGTSTVNYGGADQNVLVGPYYSLTLSNTGTKAFTGATTINNTFSINNNVVANLGNLTHTATVYFLAGTQQSIGSWGGTGSTATNKNSVNFSPIVTGILNVTAGCAAGYWKGTTSTDWNIASNWCDGTVPTAATNVIIPSSPTNQPVIGKLGGLCNSITINSGASLTQKNDSASNLFVSGNWANNGTYNSGKGTVTFSGASAQTIGGGNSTSFYNLTLQNTGGATLNKPTTVTGTLLLVSGNLVSTSTNLLSITNTTKSAIMGGSSTSYINGPVKWTIPNNNIGATYLFPVGKTTYLPLSVISPNQGWNTTTLTVEAFDGDAGGSIDGTLASASNLEYWSLQTVNLKYCSISLGKNGGIYPYDAIAASLTRTGTYTSLGGIPDFYSVNNSSTIQIDSSPDRFLKLGRTSTPRINIAPTVLGGFGYTFNFGPSNVQQFTVNGTSLTGDILITAPTNFEISTSPSTGFQQSITLLRVGSLVDNTTLYIRLKAGLAVATYSEAMTFASTGVITKNIVCSGTVFATTPTILTSGGRTCPPIDQIQLGSSSNDITILYWTGPNGYYSQEKNPVLGPPTTLAMNGTYTVTGSLPIGANLVINGDFEQGDAGFLSSYKSATDLVPEGLYAIVANPQSVHGSFSTDPDHTAAPGTLQMVVNGAIVANVTVWSQTIAVTPNSNYQFSYWLQSVVGNNPSQLQTFANNQATGTTFTATTQTGIWTQYFYNWYSGSNTSVTIDIRNQNTVAGGNDFALDDIVFRAVTQVSSSVNVTASLTAAVSITTTTPTITTGTNSVFTATPTNGGTAPTYQWIVNGSNIGSSTSSSTFNYVPANGDVITCIMTSNNSCTDPKTATSNAITMTVNGTKNYWIGNASTVWSNPSNWTATKVPASGDNVEFATTANNSGVAAINDLYVDYNRIVGSIINNASGKNLVIPADKEVVVNNLITLTQVDANTKYDQIQIKCDPNPVDASRLPNGSIIFKNASNVNGTVEMYSKSTINASGPVDYQYFWQYFGVPVTTVTAEPTLYGAYVRRAYEPGTDGDPYYWTELTNADPLNMFIGHEICQTSPTVYTFKGQLVNTDFDSGLLAYTSTAKYPGQHLYANSYTAAIDIKKIELGSDMEQSIFLYNTGSYGDWNFHTGGTSNGSLAGQYISVPLATAGSNGVPGEVPSMSSMLVKTGANASAQSYLKFNYKDVIIKNSTIQRVKSVDAISSTDLISTMIDLTGQHYSDRMWIFTEPSCTRNFDNGWDGRKILGSSLAPQIYALEPDGDYQVNSVSDMHNTDLAFQAGDEVEYTLKFTHQNIQQRYAGVYLVDLIENKTVDVTQSGSTYTFATAQSDAPAKRFKILTRPYEKDAPDTEAQVKIFTAPGRVFVHNLTTFKGECTLYDIAGRAIKNASFAANAVTEVLSNLTPGAYVVNTITNGEKLSKRVIVQ